MTLHSLALKFVEQEREAMPFELAEFPLATEPIANKLSSEAARRYEIDPRSLRTATSIFKRSRVRPNQAVAAAEKSGKASDLKLALAYKDLDRRMREAKVLDFDSLMLEMVELMDKSAAVRERWSYKFVICDEAQDCCQTDWKLLYLLSSKYGNLMCVGDPGQSVFGFRGASPSMFLNMNEMFPNVQKLFLATNYRSSIELVEFLKGIGPVQELAEKFTTPNPHGPTPKILGFKSSAEEAEFVVQSVKNGG
jgi:DNA helicase-2/ATP-dependent DNA helicase PcrA